MNINIPYGSKAFPAEFPDTATTLTVKEPLSSITPETFLKKVSNELKLRSIDLSDTIIIVADKTRVCGYATYLPLLVQALQESGLDDEQLRFIIAYGTHPRQSDSECFTCYGEIYSRYPFIHHDCSDQALFTDCGTTTRGVPIRLRSDILKATCVITMGPICHHYFAGYGGGRKLVFPGCGEREAVYANHGLYLDRANGVLAKNCQPGILNDNPLAEDLFEIEAKKEANLAIHGIMNSLGEICDVIVGSGKNSYLEACSRHGELYESTSPSFPVVIASCGGFPKDINFIQSHKAIHNAAMFVEDGGTLLVFSECRDGIGSQTFLPWFKMGGFTGAFKALSENYQGNGGTALAMMTKTGRIRITLVTELDEDICTTIGVEKWSYDKALAYISEQKQQVGYIANASLLVKKQEPEKIDSQRAS
jgi:nickel-dependent lactate racemase